MLHIQTLQFMPSLAEHMEIEMDVIVIGILVDSRERILKLL